MSERDLYRQIARATGESMNTISSMGFVLNPSDEMERPPQVVDWDELHASRRVPVIPQKQPRSAAL
jgi:hypothetical protein